MGPCPGALFAMADLEENARGKAAGKKEIVISPVAMEIVRRIDALFEIERSINGQNADQRKAVRRRARRSSPIWKPIWASSAPSSPAVTIWPRP